jgi:DNA-directed RNA polymerase specialized sigma24 family protein
MRVLASGGFLGEGTMNSRDTSEFEAFVETMRPRLIHAFVAIRGVDGAADAAAEAIAYAFEHWPKVSTMENPAGYLYRVGQTRTRSRRPPLLPPPVELGVPDVEPGLVPALRALPDSQRTAVWLVHGCHWRYSEVAEAMGTSVSMVGTNVSRALASLRRQLEVEDHA